MSNKRLGFSLLGAFLLIVVGPVIVAQLTSPPGRALEGVNLAETKYQEIRFRNEAQRIDLAGMLFVPEGMGPFPAAVVIHGSGTSQRDNRWYLTLAYNLQQRGVTVLLPDKRGSEQSAGDWRTASFEDLATDTWAAVSFLQDQQSVAVSKIGVIGLSQGGQIAPLVASKSAEVAFLVNIVGGGVPLHDLLLYEENHNLREMGFLPGVSNVIASLSTSYLVHVGQKDFWSVVGNFDPLPFWDKLTVPALVLYGQADTNVNAAESAARIRSLGKENIEVMVYENSGHALEDPIGAGNRIMRMDALMRIAEFIGSP